MTLVPEPPFFGPMPRCCSLSSVFRKMFGPIGFVRFPGNRKMLAARDALEIIQFIIENVPIPMVDVAALRDFAERRHPNIPMKASPASRQIPLTWPHTIQAAIEILCNRVKDDRIDVPG